MSYRVVLLGPPASGKGTQAAALSESLRVPHVSTGQLFREAGRRGGAAGKAVQSFIENGQLVPDEITIGVVEEWLLARGRDPEFIFDGFPRTLAQARAFARMLDTASLPQPTVVFLDVDEAATLARVLGRLGCENCGKLYHEALDPPRQAGVCDQCGHRLERRRDDSAETVRERLRQYRELTMPVVEYYSAAGVLQRVDGAQDKARVFADVLRITKA